MSGRSQHATDAQAAQLSFLAIYNPSLGDSDDTLYDQIVYYYSKAESLERRRKVNEDAELKEDRKAKNERMRQIGLAQGMIEFAKSFSDGEAVDSIETEKSRIVLHELETGWWIVASVDLTRLTSTFDMRLPQATEPSVEYSAREVCPPGLLVQQILRAHNVFLLHHAPSVADLYVRLTRPIFCSALKRFWDVFAWNWDVLLHGNPAVDVFNGLKLAAGGELGIGVGEEEWGSGEREVLEGFIQRTDGLVDLVVSRFGDAPQVPTIASKTSVPTAAPVFSKQEKVCWQGTGQAPRPSDGVIFSGIGALTRSSLRDISSWMEWLYTYGQDAYGIRDNPASSYRRKRMKARPASRQSSSTASGKADTRGIEPLQQPQYSTSIPPPIVAPMRMSSSKTVTLAQSFEDNNVSQEKTNTRSSTLPNDSVSNTETLVKYLTLGLYGSSWGIPSGRSISTHQVSSLHQQDSNKDRGPDLTGKVLSNVKSLAKITPSKKTRMWDNSDGYFMIGLQGDLKQELGVEDEEEDTEVGTDREGGIENKSWNSRTILRTVHVERVRKEITKSSKVSNDHDTEEVDESVTSYFDRQRVVVYVHQPFIFTFLFELHTDSLAISSFYRSLHHQLGPLQRSLLSSTSPSKVSERLWEAASPKSTTSAGSSQPIYDLVYDPANMTVHTTIPNIPDQGTTTAEGLRPIEAPWTRVEALSAHLQILNTYTSTRRHTSELERTCKTTRGWWVVWMRLPRAPVAQNGIHREAFLIRKASDYIAPGARKTIGRFGRDTSGPSAASGWGPGKLAEGIGIDARQYIEGLLSLNR